MRDKLLRKLQRGRAGRDPVCPAFSLPQLVRWRLEPGAEPSKAPFTDQNPTLETISGDLASLAGRNVSFLYTQ